MYNNQGAGRSFPVEQTNSYGRIMIRKQMKMHNSLVRTANVKVEDKIDSRVEKQMEVFHKAERFKDPYMVVMKRIEDDAVLNRLIAGAQSACDTQLSAHALRFKKLRAAKASWEPSYLQRTEHKSAMSTHERVVKNASSIIDSGTPMKAMNFKKVLNQTHYTKGGFPRFKRKKRVYATVPGPLSREAIEETEELDVENVLEETRQISQGCTNAQANYKHAAPCEQPSDSNPAPRQRKCIREKRKNPAPQKRAAKRSGNARRASDSEKPKAAAAALSPPGTPAPLTKSEVSMHHGANPSSDFTQEDWEMLKCWLWNFGRTYVKQIERNLPGQLLYAAESMNQLQEQYESGVDKVCKEATGPFLTAAVHFILQHGSHPKADRQQQIRELTETGCKPAVLMHIQKIMQYSNCLDRPELPQLRESDRPAIAYHVFSLAGVLQDMARELQTEERADKSLQEEIHQLAVADNSTNSQCIEGDILEELVDEAREPPAKEFKSARPL